MTDTNLKNIKHINRSNFAFVQILSKKKIRIVYGLIGYLCAYTKRLFIAKELIICLSKIAYAILIMPT